jgi:peptide/nickel transport system permease protein
MKKFFFLLFFPIFLTFAHKISVFIDYEDGKATVYTYFSDGTPAKNALVKIIDEKTNKVVLTGKTDQNGIFTFKVPYDGKFKVEVDAELGHKAVAELIAVDEDGRDMLNRVLLGARFSFIIALSVVGLALLIGVPIGLIAGYVGGRLGTALMRVTDMFLAFPPLLLAIVLAATLGRGLENTIIALAISWWPWYSRLIFIQASSIKNSQYVDAAKVLGLNPLVIMFKHVLPNALTPVTVQAALDMGSAILEAAGLSFLGIGVKPPTPEWGLLVSLGWQSINRAWWISFFPGLSIVIVVLGFNLLADAVREAMDPRLRKATLMKGV